VNPVPDIYRILPSDSHPHRAAVMVIDASIPPSWPRRFLGWVAAIGTTIALWLASGSFHYLKEPAFSPLSKPAPSRSSSMS